MNNQILVAVAALFLTSVCVRVLPVFAKLSLNEKSQLILERYIPLSVFINFLVYLLYTELKEFPIAAIIALGVMFVMLALRKFNNLIVVIITSALYYVINSQN